MRFLLLLGLILSLACTGLKPEDDRRDGSVPDDAATDTMTEDATPDVAEDVAPDTGEGCSTNADCRAENGFGSVCGDDGLCATVEAHPRCQLTYPDDLYDRMDEFSVIMGNLMSRNLETHQARERSARLAFVQANESDGLAGEDVGLILCTIEENSDFDDLARRDAAQAAAIWLSQEVGVPGIVGPAASSDTQAVFTALQDADADTVIISPSATSVTLVELDGVSPSDENPELLWRTCPPDSAQGIALADDLIARGVMSVAAVVESGAYGESLLNVFLAAYRERGGDLAGTAHIFTAESGSSRSEQIALAGAETTSEVLFISSQAADTVALMSAIAVDSNFDDKSILLPDGGASSEVIMAVPSDFDNRVRGTRPAPASGAIYDTFLGAYASEYAGQSPADFTFTAHAYDAAWMLLYGAAYASAQEEAITGTTIARGMRQLSGDGVSETRLVGSSWPTARSAFRTAGRQLNIAGASGDLDYDPDTEETTGTIEYWGVRYCDAEATLQLTNTAGEAVACPE